MGVINPHPETRADPERLAIWWLRRYRRGPALGLDEQITNLCTRFVSEEQARAALALAMMRGWLVVSDAVNDPDYPWPASWPTPYVVTEAFTPVARATKKDANR